MAIFSDGTTDVEIDYVREVDKSDIEKSTTRSSGGLTKSQMTGERFRLEVSAHLTAAEYRSLKNILKAAGTTEFYYTPEDTTEWATTYDDVSFPLNVTIDDVTLEWDNRNAYYLNCIIESVDYI